MTATSSNSAIFQPLFFFFVFALSARCALRYLEQSRLIRFFDLSCPAFFEEIADPLYS
jgi:hypothetical protein